MVRTDYKKDYIVPQIRIPKSREMIREVNNLVYLLKISMGNKKTVSTAGGREIGGVDMNRGIFQGDSLSSYLFIVTWCLQIIWNFLELAEVN